MCYVRVYLFICVSVYFLCVSVSVLRQIFSHNYGPPGLEIRNVRGDGHCCFRAYLFLLGFPRSEEKIKLIRSQLAAFMFRNRKFFADVFIGRKYFKLFKLFKMLFILFDYFFF